ncbi:MAG: DUF4340 domain-containing protein [Phycisphaerales bacterium]|nr:MAG: DUF4340 domain-containing protein [Phycisphaerales bacterium]
MHTEIGGVTAMRRRADGHEEVLRRTGDPARPIWVLEWADATGRTHLWPVATDRVRAALRVLSTTTGETGTARTDAPPDPAWPRLVLVSNDAERELVFEPGSLGGRARVWVDGRPRMVTSDTSDAFGRQSLTAWLDRRLLPPIPADPETPGRGGIQRLTFEAETGAGRARLALMRGPRGWSILEPLVAPASSERVGEALRAVQQLEWTRVAVGVEASEAGLDRPTAVLTMTAPGGGTRRAVVGSAVPGRGTVFVRLEREGGDLLVEAPREGLERLPLDPGAYADRRATEAASADVRTLRLRWLATGNGMPTEPTEGPDAGRGADPNRAADLTLTRAMDAWRIGVAPNDAPGDADTRAAINALVRLLTASEADRVSASPIVGAAPLVGVELAGSDGLAIGVATVYVTESSVIVRTGELWRSYDPQPLVPMIAWLASQTGEPESTPDE